MFPSFLSLRTSCIFTLLSFPIEVSRGHILFSFFFGVANSPENTEIYVPFSNPIEVVTVELLRHFLLESP